MYELNPPFFKYLLWVLVFGSAPSFALFGQGDVSPTQILQNISNDIERGQWKKAHNNALDIIYNPPSTLSTNQQSDTYILMGRCKQLFVQHDSAIYYLTVALNTLPDNQPDNEIKLHAYLVQSLAAKRNFDAARNQLILIDSLLSVHKNVAKETTSLTHFTGASFWARQGEWEKGIELATQALLLQEKVRDGLTKTLGDIHSFLGNAYRRINASIEAEQHLNTAVYIFQQIGGEDNDNLGPPFVNLGALYQDMGYSNRALDLYEKAINIFKSQQERHPYLSILYNNLGNSYTGIGENELAIKYIKESISFNPDNPRAWAYYGNLGSAYLRSGDLEKAFENYSIAEQNQPRGTGRRTEDIARIYHDLGVCHLKRKEYKNAFKQIQKGRKMWLNRWGLFHLDMAHSYMEMGKFYAATGNIPSSISQVDTALFIQKKLIPSHIHEEIAMACLIQANNFAAIHNYKKAQTYFDTALIACGYNMGGFEEIYAPEQYLKTLGQKALFLEKRWAGTQQLDYARQAHQIYIHIAEGLDYWQKSLLGDQSKLNLITQNYPIFERGVKNAFRMWTRENESEYLHAAFRLAEQSKSALLMESIQNNKAISFANVPDSLRQKERDLKERIHFLKDNIQRLAFKPKEDVGSVKENFNEQYLSATQKYKSLEQQILKLSPDYYNLKNRPLKTSVTDIQAHLNGKDHTAFIEYLLGDSTLFVFVIKNTSFEIHQIPIDFPLQRSINDLRAGIYDYHLSDNRSEALYDKYNKLYADNAFLLYQKLLSPLGELPEILVIIPDNILGYIPFEALLTARPGENHTFKSHSYLSGKHQISYNFSASLWKEMMEKNHGETTYDLLAFAPSFGEKTPADTEVSRLTRAQLHPLQFNEDEVRQIQQLIGGKILLKQEASLDNFINLAPEYSILHFATHAKLNDIQTDYSYLALNGADTESGKLYIHDLYNLHLPLEMVVLSACETGIGKLNKGEGIISLGRGFVYSGAKSMITSLWSANDRSTFRIMASFYENMKSGHSKDQALSFAKKDYLNQSSHQTAHPFYWATFVAFGDMSPLELKPYSFLWWIAAIVGISLLFFVVRYFKN